MLREGGEAMRVGPALLCCACAAGIPRERRPAAQRPAASDCATDQGETCYRRGRELLESRRPEVAQRSMEEIDNACAAGHDPACDLASLAFDAPRRAGADGRARMTHEVREPRDGGAAVVRCVLGADGVLRGCAALQPEAGVDARVLEGLSGRTYEPATWGGNPVEVPFDIDVAARR
jgi:hypothetical protein